MLEQRKNMHTVTGTRGRKPNYFFVAFGAKYAGVNPVEGPIYPHQNGYVSNSGIQSGDVMILYCCGGYPGHDQEAPGIGVVTRLTQNKNDAQLTNIHYQYFPLSCPVDWNTISTSILELAGKKRNFSLAGNILRKISNNSFRSAIAGQQINWP
jgi:hypothetical protein